MTITTPVECYATALSVMRSIHNGHEPSHPYMEAGARLLTGTAAHESGGFKHTRQIGFGFDDLRGAWGICEVESISVKETMRRLTRKRDLAGRCAAWLYREEKAYQHHTWYLDFGVLGICHLMSVSTRASILFARLHYLWEPEAIPYTVSEQGEYYKRYFNKTGKATANSFIDAWDRYCREPLARAGIREVT